MDKHKLSNSSILVSLFSRYLSFLLTTFWMTVLFFSIIEWISAEPGPYKGKALEIYTKLRENLMRLVRILYIHFYFSYVWRLLNLPYISCFFSHWKECGEFLLWEWLSMGTIWQCCRRKGQRSSSLHRMDISDSSDNGWSFLEHMRKTKKMWNV